jgi:anion-transporting  ArsA/GET3 family ATPase
MSTPPQSGFARPPRRLDIDALIGDPATRIVLCCGSGGVGKTTTAAAVGLRAAEQGRRVVVLTIDPARRLAQSMGLTELDNVPRPVVGVDRAAGGELFAMMLDMKRTFDELVEAHAEPARVEQTLANPFYQSLSTSLAGTQEYMAMEKLGQLSEQSLREGRWDLIVVDTPPSRSALDFLDAPSRLGTFLDGRFVRILSAPARGAGRGIGRLFGAGLGIVGGILQKVLGTQLLLEVSLFVQALDSIFGGFRERAERTYSLLQQPGTQFLVVAAPERDALREAAYFVDRLQADQMPLAGLVLNRVVVPRVPGLTLEDAIAGADRLERGTPTPQDRAAAGVLRLHADRVRTSARQSHLAERFTLAHPSVAVKRVPALADDVHDLEGLRAIGQFLAEGV